MHVSKLNGKCTFPLIAMLLFSLTSCTDQGTADNPCQIDYEQVEIYRQLADAFIIPGYTILNERLEKLHTAAEAFSTAPSVQALDLLKSEFESAWIQWQYVAQFNFGPAEQVSLRGSLNPFPTQPALIHQHIENSFWNLDAPMTYDKGYPALDYLLYGIAGSSEEVLGYFVQHPQAGIFLTDNTNWMLEKAEFVLQEWQSTYRDAFLSNTGTAAGTSLSLIVNSLNEHYELIKREKLGIPIGIQTLGIPNPDRVEAPFSGLSLLLLQSALEASEAYFRGLTGQGLDDYLDAAEAQKNEELLSVVIKRQFQKARQAAGNLQAPLRESILEYPEDALAAYEEMTALIPLIKTDMPSVLCVSITYIDNPSDSD